LGRQQDQDVGRRRPGHALGDQPLELFHERRQLQQEREDQDRDQRRRDDFPNDVAVQRLQQHFSLSGYV
jgi:hypothetical protein